MSNARWRASGESWSCQTFVVTKSSSRFTPEAAIAAPTAVSLSYMAAVSRWRKPSAMALSTTGCDSPPGILNVPKPRRGMSTPWVLIIFMKAFLS
jgi:hypothetical protein